jgi:Lrp/AsnC family transcriptional regulator for asnA, asnC and gidA
MDELDRLILQTLQEDGRTPFTRIARAAGVSETTVRNRYQKLVALGIIRTVGIVDPYALGFEAPALVAISVEPGSIDRVARAIGKLSEVSYLVMTLGSRDMMAEVFCHNLDHLTQLVTQKILVVPGVRSTETLMIARSYKLAYRWTPDLVSAQGEE